MSFPRYPDYKDSGVEWLGSLPSHWETCRTKNLFSLMKREPLVDDEIVTAFRDGEVTLRTNRRVEGFTNAIHEHGYQRILRGDLVIHAMDAFAGAIGVSDSDGKSTPVYSVCTPKSPAVDTQYFGQLMRYMAVSGYINALSKGIRERSTEFRWNEASNVTLALPPVSEQTQIAAFLDRETAKIDALVTEQRRLMALLKEKRQAVISHAVTRGLNLHVPMKPSGIEWLGDVPAHWEVKPMRMIANVVRGASPRPAGDPRYFGGDAVPWVTVGEITKDDDVYLTVTEFFLTEEGATHSNLFKSGTLIYSNSGATLGVPKVLSIDACANDGVVAFFKLDDRVQVEFLYHYLASITDSIREKVKQGSGQPNLNTDIVKDLRFGLPPLPEQELIVSRITELANEFGTLTTEAQRAIDLLQERRTALISAAVTGQIDVRGVAQIL